MDSLKPPGHSKMSCFHVILWLNYIIKKGFSLLRFTALTINRHNISCWFFTIFTTNRQVWPETTGWQGSTPPLPTDFLSHASSGFSHTQRVQGYYPQRACWCAAYTLFMSAGSIWACTQVLTLNTFGGLITLTTECSSTQTAIVNPKQLLITSEPNLRPLTLTWGLFKQDIGL